LQWDLLASDRQGVEVERERGTHPGIAVFVVFSLCKAKVPTVVNARASFVFVPRKAARKRMHENAQFAAVLAKIRIHRHKGLAWDPNLIRPGGVRSDRVGVHAEERNGDERAVTAESEDGALDRVWAGENRCLGWGCCCEGMSGMG